MGPGVGVAVGFGPGVGVTVGLGVAVGDGVPVPATFSVYVFVAVTELSEFDFAVRVTVYVPVAALAAGVIVSLMDAAAFAFRLPPLYPPRVHQASGMPPTVMVNESATVPVFEIMALCSMAVPGLTWYLLMSVPSCPLYLTKRFDRLTP